MKSLKKNNRKFKKVTLVVSDFHLGAGFYVHGKRNYLEDFHMDDEFIEFLHYYASGEYANKEVELIINGDFLDLLAVPYIPFFDDEFWSETAALEKLKMIVDAHREVFDALEVFIQNKKKTIRYIIGNHDAELIFPKLQSYLKECFSESVRNRFILTSNEESYMPVKGVYIQHGHEYERAHHFSLSENIINSSKGERYFLPPWGSYYVTHVINRYKPERYFVNEVKPVKNFIIHGLIYDTFFTLRFMFANFYYFFMVRFLHYFVKRNSWMTLKDDIKRELEVWQDYETLTRDFFENKQDAKALIVGHTHQATLRNYPDGTTFINTGTWMRVINLDFNRLKQGHFLTFAKIYSTGKDFELEQFNENVELELNVWKGRRDRPYDEFA